MHRYIDRQTGNLVAIIFTDCELHTRLLGLSDHGGRADGLTDVPGATDDAEHH